MAAKNSERKQKTEESERRSKESSTPGQENHDGTAPAQPAAQPIELTGAAPPPKRELGAFKKLFFKIGEKVGTQKVTGFSPEYIAAVTEIDVYKLALQQLILTMTHLVQQNPKYSEIDRKSLESPQGEDPFEILQHKLAKYAEVSHNKKGVEAVAQSAKRLATIHREFQDKARKCFHMIRTFLKVDMENIRGEREEVMKVKQQYDYARYDYDSNPNDSGTAQAFRRANATYEAAVKRVFDIVTEMREKQKVHRVEVVRFLQEYRNYNRMVAQEWEKFGPALAKIESFEAIQSRAPPPSQQQPSSKS